MSGTGFLERVWDWLRRLASPKGSLRSPADSEPTLAQAQATADGTGLPDTDTQGLTRPRTSERPVVQQSAAEVGGAGVTPDGSPTSGLWGVVPSALAVWSDAGAVTPESGTVFPSGWEDQGGVPTGGRFSRGADGEAEAVGTDRVRLGTLPAASRDGEQEEGFTRGASLSLGSLGDPTSGVEWQDEHRETAGQLAGPRGVQPRRGLRDTTLSTPLATLRRGAIPPFSGFPAAQGVGGGQVRAVPAEAGRHTALSRESPWVAAQHTPGTEGADGPVANEISRTPFRFVIHFVLPRDEANVLGTPGEDVLLGDATSDVLDGGDGGDDVLSGLGGGDTYLLGFDTDHDIVREDHLNPGGDADDAIRLKRGIDADQVRVVRSGTGTDLVVELLGQDGSVAASLTVADHFVRDEAKIERVALASGWTLWDSNDFLGTEIVGHSGPDTLVGLRGTDDVFDSDAGGNDVLFGGGGGRDVYLLGHGTGHDWINKYRNGRPSPEDSPEDTDHLDRTLIGPGHDWLYYGDHHYWLYSAEGPSWGESSEDTDNIGDVIRLKRGIGVNQVQLRRKADNLVVDLLEKGGAVSDSLTVDAYFSVDHPVVDRVELWDGTLVWDSEELESAVFLGHSGDDRLIDVNHNWRTTNDVMDGGPGGTDTLVGLSGNDVYLLGFGTGHDTVQEHLVGYGARRVGPYGREWEDLGGDPDDVIRLKDGIGADQVRVTRGDAGNLVVQLLDEDGSVSDSLTVLWHFNRDDAKIERVELWDGTLVWDSDDQITEHIGGPGDDRLHGFNTLDDVLDGGLGGSDFLAGRRGDDVYLLGFGTDHDLIYERPDLYPHDPDLDGDPSDVIRLKSGIDASQVRFVRDFDTTNLVVQLLDEDGSVSDSLTVYQHFRMDNAKIERVELWDGTIVWDASDLAAAAYGGFGYRGDGFGQEEDGVLLLYYGGGGTIDENYWERNPGGITTIRVVDGSGPEQVRLRRSAHGRDLHVELARPYGPVLDSVVVKGFYVRDDITVERVQFGLVDMWDKDDLLAAGRFSRFEDDHLRGNPGFNDVYLLDREIGHATIREYNYSGGVDINVHIDWIPLTLLAHDPFSGGPNPMALRDHVVGGVAPDRYEGLIRTPLGGDPNDVIRVKNGITVDQVRLSRHGNGADLRVELLDDRGEVTDSLTVAWFYTHQEARVERVELGDGHAWDLDDLLQMEITGRTGDDYLRGSSSTEDVFDADAGGNDLLAGLAENDVYLLGHGTGHDMIKEEQSGHTGDPGDMIRVKSGIGPGRVRLWREGAGSTYGDRDLLVQILNDNGSVTDSLRVIDYYTKASARVETVEFADDPTVWDAADLALVEIAGYTGEDALLGSDNFEDVFDADAGGNDTLYGRGGGDTYLLGEGTGDDVINEHSWGDSPRSGPTPVPQGDGTDVIRAKDGIGISDIRLERQGDHLVVHLVGDEEISTDSLTADSHFTNPRGEVERIEADGRVLLAHDFVDFIQVVAAFNAGGARFATMDLLLNSYWQDEGTLTGPAQS